MQCYATATPSLISPTRLTCCRYFTISPPRLTLLLRLYFHVFGHASPWIYWHVGPHRRWSNSLLFLVPTHVLIMRLRTGVPLQCTRPDIGMNAIQRELTYEGV